MAWFLSAAPSVSLQLQLETDPTDSRAHCRALSSDEDSFCEGETGDDVSRTGVSISASSNNSSTTRQYRHELRSSGLHPLSSSVIHSSLVNPSADAHSSGYSSVQSSSPSSSSLLPCSLSPLPSSSSPPNRLPGVGFRLLVPAQGPIGRQVKRKNGAAHSGEEREEGDQEEGGRVFPSLWDETWCLSRSSEALCFFIKYYYWGICQVSRRNIWTSTCALAPSYQLYSFFVCFVLFYFVLFYLFL